MSRIDEDFANDIRAALSRSSTARFWPLLLVVAGLLGGGLAWAYFAQIEEITRGDGRVIPSRQVQVVQSLDAGIVSQIYVQEGDVVEEGQPLLEIDDTSATSSVGEVAQRLASLRLRIARLRAEAAGADLALEDLRKLAPERALEEENLFAARRIALEQNVAVVENQIAQRELELTELETRQEQTRAVLASMEEEYTLGRRLSQSGAFPRMELLQLKRQVQGERRELASVESSIPRARQAISEAKSRREAISLEFQARAREELSTAIAEVAVLEENIRRLRDRVDRTSLRSPVKGVVNSLPVTTIGSVIQPAATLVEIVPIDDRLLIEARVSPRDVAFLRPGQAARVKITAYDFTIYGDLEGRLVRLGADSVIDDEGAIYYRAIVETDEAFLRSEGEELPIIPGMIASVDILTGEKTVLSYLLGPFNRMRAEALRER